MEEFGRHEEGCEDAVGGSHQGFGRREGGGECESFAWSLVSLSSLTEIGGWERKVLESA